MTTKMGSDDLAFDKNHCHLLWIIGKISSAGDWFPFHANPASLVYKVSTGNGRTDSLG
jgi:hypothetical protein